MSTTTTSHTHTTNSMTLDFKVKYKTEKCRYWYERGFCPFGQWCAFAHHSDELREKAHITQSYKTKVCLNFKTHGYCKYGQRCHFLHPNETDAAETSSVASQPVRGQKRRELDGKRHRGEMEAIREFGLEVFWRLRRGRSAAWTGLIAGESETESARSMQLEEAFPDYDFRRKPRLGSM